MIEKIWSQDPPYDLKGEFWNISIKDGIMPELGVGFMPKPYQQPRPPIFISLASPSSSSAQDRGAARLGHDLGQHHPDLFGGVALDGLQQGLRRARHRSRNGDNWRVARNVMVAPSDAEAHDRVFGARARTAISSPTSARCWTASASCSILKPRPDMPDDEATSEAIIDECVLHGSPNDRARQAGRVPRAGRPVRHAADDRHRLGRPERGLGARVDAAARAGGHAEIPPARDSPRRRSNSTGDTHRASPPAASGCGGNCPARPAPTTA